MLSLLSDDVSWRADQREARLRPGGGRGLSVTEVALIVFPSEPPVAMTDGPERSTAVKGAPVFGAAKRTLDGEHRSGSGIASTGGVAGS